MKKLRFFLFCAVGLIAFLAIGSSTGMLHIGALAGGLSGITLAFMLPAGITASEYLRTLTESRSQLAAEMKTLVDKDTLTADEQTRFIDLEKRIAKLDEDIAEITRHIAAERERADAEARRQTLRNAGGGIQRIDVNGDKDLKNFRFSRFINSLRSGKLSGLEAEMAQEYKLEAQRSGIAVQSEFGIPGIVLGQRGVTAGAAGTGKYLVTDEPIQFIDALMDYLVLVQLGAQYFDGLVGNLPLTSDSDVASAVWVDENGDSTETTPTFSRATMTPKRLSAFVEMSNALLIQGSVGVENKIRRQLAAAMANAIQIAAINGSGNAPTPRGILNTVGIGSVVMGANGGAVTWPKMVELETKVDSANALLGNLAYLTNSKVRGALKTTVKEAGSGLYLMEGKEMNGYPVAITNHVPSNLTKGTSNGVCSAAIFGNFADLAIGQWAGLDITADPYGKLKKGATDIVLNSYNDVAVLRAASFAASADITT
jgi:HK97 family phage major capsid protein